MDFQELFTNLFDFINWFIQLIKDLVAGIKGETETKAEETTV